MTNRSELGISTDEGHLHSERLVLVPPRLILITGTGGVGKTTLAQGLFVDGAKVHDGLLDVVAGIFVSKDGVADEITQSCGSGYVAVGRSQALPDS